MKGYGRLALDLVQKPVGNGIVGHKTKDGFVVRYNTKTGDFVKGNPKRSMVLRQCLSLNLNTMKSRNSEIRRHKNER